MLVLEDVTKKFGDVTAVDRVSLQVPRRQMVAIVGPSGAGKSTLLRMINRLGQPTDGGIRFDDEDVSSLTGAALRRWRMRSAMIFQQFNLIGRLDVVTNVMLGRLNRMNFLRSMIARFTDEERTMAVQALDRLDIAPVALQRAETLSGGQQQRVAIARSLMQEPDLVLADEPIASLDPRNAARVMEALRNINKEDGITVICNLHTLDTAHTYCDRIIGMNGGAIVFDDEPHKLDDAQAREIYGAEEYEEAFRQAA